MRGHPFQRFWNRIAIFKRRNRHGHLLLPVVLGLSLALFFIHRFDVTLRPQLIALAQSQLHSQLTHIAESAVVDSLAAENLTYSDLVVRQGFLEGEITTFSTDTVRLNQLRASILTDITEKIISLDSHLLSVPLGTLTGIDFFAASGPGLPVQIVSVASASGHYRNELSEAGINQSVYRVMLDVTITVDLLLPGGIAETSVSTPICISETLIVGQVPQTYLNWNP